MPYRAPFNSWWRFRARKSTKPPRSYTVQVSDEHYARLTLMAVERGVTTKAVLEMALGAPWRI